MVDSAVSFWRLFFIKKNNPFVMKGLFAFVRKRRFELPCPFEHNDLNVARLPVSPPPQELAFANVQFLGELNKFYVRIFLCY